MDLASGRLPWKRNQQCEIHSDQILSLHKKGKDLYHSIMFCGPGRVLQAGTDFVNKPAKNKKELLIHSF